MGRNSPAAVAQRSNLTQLRAAAVSKMSPRLRNVFDSIDHEVVDHLGATIEFYHNVGCKLLEVTESPDAYLTSAQKAENVSPTALLLQAFGGAKDAMSRAMVFATLYTKADIHRLLAMTSKQHPDFHFQWAHIRHLISIDPRDVNSQVRLEFEQRTRENGWDPDDLAQALAKYYGGKRRGGGRPLSIPKTLKAQVEQVLEMSDLFLRRHKEVWNGQKHSIFVNIMNQPSTARDGELATSVQAIKNRIGAIREVADDMLAMCERTAEYLETKIETPQAETATAKTVALRQRKLATTKK